MRVKPGQVITIREKSKDLVVVKEALESVVVRQEYVLFDEDKVAATFTRLPERTEILPEIKENLIVELYNR